MYCKLASLVLGARPAASDARLPDSESSELDGVRAEAAAYPRGDRRFAAFWEQRRLQERPRAQLRASEA